MRRKLRWGNLGSRVIALVITFSMIVSLITVLGGSASAATSLSGIENIKSRGSISVLEIVPKEGTGSIGYYVGHQEPTADWLDVLASTVGKDSRQTYANQLFANLKAVGLMGSSGQNNADYPLIQTGDYAEYLPWANNIPEDAEPLTLNQTEETKVNGSFTPDETGDYIEANTYVFDAAGGDYVENALYYQYGELSGETYYYCLNFERVQLTESNVTNYIGVPLYVPVADPDFPGHTYYKYAGTLKHGGGFTIEDEINDGIGYFVGTVAAGQPSAAWEFLQEVAVTAETVPSLVGSMLYMAEETGFTAVTIEAGYVPVEGAVYYKQARSYYAVPDPNMPYREAVTGETGYFDQIIGYRFVGNGNAPYGEAYYKFTASAGGTAQNMVYDTVYVTGGYTNSDWFKRYVLDMDGLSSEVLAAMRVNVSCLTPNQLTETAVKNANLVVVSAGFDLSANGSTVAYTMDVSESVFNELKSKPRVVDSRISGATRLANLMDGPNIPGVTANNVYNFAAGTGADARSALATNKFHTPFTDKTPYKVVEDEITYENFLRDNEDLLATDISMASCIRYILNTHRVQNKKTSLNVLDIQPYAKKYGNDNTLSVETVLSWLPQETQNTLKKESGTGYNINITHMSTAELVCKVEDLSEQYDLIYIGANEAGKNLSDDLYYANIGKEISVASQLKGLLRSNDTKARYSGNDLTPQKKTELLEYANAGLPIVVSDKLVSGGTVGAGRTLTAEITASGTTLTANYTLNPAADASDISSVRYQWYRYSSNSYNPTPVGTGITYTPTSTSTSYRYYCDVSVTLDDVTRTARSNTLRRSSGGIGGYTGYELEKINSGSFQNWQNSDGDRFTGNENLTEQADRKLTVSYSNINPNLNNVVNNGITYTWRRTDSSYWSDNDDGTYTIPNDGKYYYCIITIKYTRSNSGGGSNWWDDLWPGLGGGPGGGSTSTYTATCTSPAYRVVTKSSVGSNYYTHVSNGTPATFPGAVIGGNAMDPSKVDPCSLMYEVLSNVWTRENVVVQSSVQRKTTGTNIPELNDNQDTLVKYLNLSRPSIDLSSHPTEYGGDLSKLAIYDCGGNLSFGFTIKNPTDPTPLQTRYTCNLYIDQNGDGRHSESERIGDLAVSEQGAGRAENGTLEAGKAYVLQRSLNQRQFSGVVAWKLEVVKVGDATVHASEKGYAYIQPTEPTAINILQIRSGNGEGVNLSSNPAQAGNNSQFINLYNQVKNANMYDITVTPTTVNKLNGDYTKTEDAFAQLDTYDMIIIGFADCYGDLDQETAQAVAQYIDTGKAVLFTHDTTSFYNVERSQATVAYKYWGYYFNQIIRDKVGLDRYGVTNTNFKEDVAAGSDGQINESEATALQQAGYTVAYVPESAKQSARATQGFTDLNIYRYGGGMSSEATTNKVSQVNKGQITQYPFQMDAELTVAETHHQYYQLNMNADDIVVWYSLSGSGGGGRYNYEANHYNDGTNAYYIYNRGNITYSGAGHSSSLSNDEAELFVNTMVAAYRAAYSKPTIEFKTADDYPTTTQLIPTEYSGAGSSQSLGSEQTIYFKLQDTNLTANKSMAVKLYYEVTAGTTGCLDMVSAGLGSSTEIYVLEATLGDVYRADNGQRVSSTALSSNVLYKTVIPAEVLNYFSAQNASETKIYLKAITTIHNGSANSTYVGSDDLTLKKLGLLRLE